MKSPVAMLKDLTAKLAGARDAVASLHDADTALRAEHAELKAERQTLVNALPPPAELLNTLEQQINTLAGGWRERNSKPLARALAGRLDVEISGAVRGLVDGKLAAAFPNALDFPTLCGLAPDVVKASLSATLRAAQYEAGPAMAERQTLIADVDARIAAVEAEHSTLVDEAGAAGIVIELMPGERGRRTKAEQHRQYVEANNRLNADAIRRGAAKAMVE